MVLQVSIFNKVQRKSFYRKVSKKMMVLFYGQITCTIIIISDEAFSDAKSSKISIWKQLFHFQIVRSRATQVETWRSRVFKAYFSFFSLRFLQLPRRLLRRLQQQWLTRKGMVRKFKNLKSEVKIFKPLKLFTLWGHMQFHHRRSSLEYHMFRWDRTLLQ